MDDGTGGDFEPLVGHMTPYLLLTFEVRSGILQGQIYRLRYRVKNAIGWSEYSPIAYALAASAPKAPLEPTFKSSTTSSATVGISRSEDNGGSPITEYRLYRDEGNNFDSEFVLVPEFDGSSETFELTTLETGKVYRLRTTAVNSVGESAHSQELIFGVGKQAPQPQSLVRSNIFSSSDSL